MPLYEYECTKCKKHTEKIQKFSDSEITQCPHCGGLLERVVSAAAISFKGGGWFKDGYSHAKQKSAKEKESKSDSGTSSVSSVEASASSGKDAKPTATRSVPAAPAAAAPAAASSEKK
jgi:putative FmdB family regulatory protein